MKSRRMVLCSVALLTVAGGLAISGSAPPSTAAGPAMLADYTWTGAGPGDLWSQQCNWTFPPVCGIDYPDGTDDNARFPVNTHDPSWAVDLTTETIGDLTIEANVDFDSASGFPCLEPAKLVVDGTDAAITLTMSGNASIYVAPEP